MSYAKYEDRLAFQRRYYVARRNVAIDYLGGKCLKCGTRDNLEFDHIDPKTKEFVISTKVLYRWDKLLPELKKCQLLCHNCHVEKSIINKEWGTQYNKGKIFSEHGTQNRYKRGCRCEKCRSTHQKIRHEKYLRTGN